MTQLFWDPVRQRLHYHTIGGSWILVGDLNPYCLRNVAKQLRQEKKEETIYWRLIADECTRRSIPVPTTKEAEAAARATRIKGTKRDPDFVTER